MTESKRAMPEWFKDVVSSIKYSKFLSLEKRKKLVHKIVERLSDEQFGEFIGDPSLASIQGGRLMAHFLGGEGKPRKLELSSDQWEYLLKSPPTSYSQSGWKPSTNPKFPASKGWEHLQIHLKGWIQGPGKQRERTERRTLHDALGLITTIRRKQVAGGYEYQIADDFDLKKGTQVLAKQVGSRTLTSFANKMIREFFPEFVLPSEAKAWEGGGGAYGQRGTTYKDIAFTRKLAEAGTPFPIQSTYFKADEKNVKVKPYKSYLTKLSAGDEKEFQVWFDRYVREVHGPLIRMNPDDKDAHYDYRGYWIDNRGEASKPMKRGIHLTDRYKIPGHPTFSIESKYYQPGMEKNTKVIQWINNKPVRIGSQQ